MQVVELVLEMLMDLALPHKEAPVEAEMELQELTSVRLQLHKPVQTV
tara:strand:+ start:429 stop:569 length:141 start_codon:yes stop_codon:yes gene_type:complete